MLDFGGTTWSFAAAPPHPQPPCAPHHPPMAPSAAPHLKRWRPRRTAATVTTRRSDIEAYKLQAVAFKRFYKCFAASEFFGVYCSWEDIAFFSSFVSVNRSLALRPLPLSSNTLFLWCALRAWTSQSLLFWGLAGPTPQYLGTFLRMRTEFYMRFITVVYLPCNPCLIQRIVGRAEPHHQRSSRKKTWGKCCWVFLNFFFFYSYCFPFLSCLFLLQNMKRRRRRDILRVQLVRIFELLADAGVISQM